MGKIAAIVKLLWPAIVKIIGLFWKPKSRNVKILELKEQVDEVTDKMAHALRSPPDWKRYWKYKRLREKLNRRVARLQRHN